MNKQQTNQINQKFDELTQIHNDIVSKLMEQYILDAFGIEDHDTRIAMIIEAQQERWSDAF